MPKTPAKRTAKAVARPRPASPPTPVEMLDRAIAAGADITTLSKLMELQERWEANQSRKAFDAAMAAAKAELPILIKGKRVDFTSQKGRTSYSYADLAEVNRVCDPVLARHGLSTRYETKTLEGGRVEVTCIISHADGHSVQNTLAAGLDQTGNKNNIQALGSTATYLQRYTKLLALGLAADVDDDARRVSTGETITEADLKKLRERMKNLGVGEEVFASYLSVETLDDLPASMTKRAFDALDQKERASAKAKADPAADTASSGSTATGA